MRLHSYYVFHLYFYSSDHTIYPWVHTNQQLLERLISQITMDRLTCDGRMTARSFIRIVCVTYTLNVSIKYPSKSDQDKSHSEFNKHPCKNLESRRTTLLSVWLVLQEISNIMVSKKLFKTHFSIYCNFNWIVINYILFVLNIHNTLYL